ncbi:cupredoxin domain-containing protein [Candidatus Gottesmanbacteria bacterium]|nr:cupredoxin domain-containing protein [Candidatus Gottesmanbacteria bacterium]
MNRSILVGIIVLLVGLGVGWFVLQGPKPEQSPEEQTPSGQMPVTPGVTEMVVVETSPGPAMEKGGVAAVAESTAQYTDSGFMPNTITVKQGTTVRFTNQSSRGMWVASAVHPTHQLLPGFDQLKSVEKGGTYEYTFAKVGTWKYHNHVNATDTGTVVVTQ